MILLVIKGLFIGLFMLIPGVSGGSIAIILDEYEKIIYHTNNLFKDFKNSFLYLFSLALGGVVGLFIGSFCLDYLINNFYFEVLYFFIGIILIFIIKLIRKSIFEGFKFYYILYVFLGVAVSLLIELIPIDFFNTENIIGLFFLGILLAIALILPGISVSYVLLIFSCYDDVLLAFRTLDFLYLFKVGFFLCIGILLTIRLLALCINKFKMPTNFMIVGFMVGSLISFIPLPNDSLELKYAIIFLLQGILISLFFDTIKKMK